MLPRHRSLVDGFPKLLSRVSSLCHNGGAFTSIAGVSIQSTRVEIEVSLQKRKKERENLY